MEHMQLLPNFHNISFDKIHLKQKKKKIKAYIFRCLFTNTWKNSKNACDIKKATESTENKGLLNTDLPCSQSACEIFWPNTLFLLVSSTWFKVRPRHLPERYFSWSICTYLFIYWVWVCIYTHLAVGLVSVGLTERGC